LVRHQPERSIATKAGNTSHEEPATISVAKTVDQDSPKTSNQ
jgi:hypothetical protein